MAPRPSTSGNGTVIRHARFPSRHTSTRHVDVWLPPGYARARAQRYPVLYMHDGQNLFDPALAFGQIDWGVDEAVTRLVTAGVIPAVIVVGVWNDAARWPDYMPGRHFTAPGMEAARTGFLETHGKAPVSDGYLRFLVEELKPFIDERYRTLPDQAHTRVMGSSMGGLISLYAISEYPEVFGGAGCVSTHWIAGGIPLVDAMAAALPDPADHRLYFDFGTATLDEHYEPFQRRMDAALRRRGYVDGLNWVTRKFEGAEHNERAWRARVEIPLAFLLGS